MVQHITALLTNVKNIDVLRKTYKVELCNGLEVPSNLGVAEESWTVRAVQLGDRRWISQSNITITQQIKGAVKATHVPVESPKKSQLSTEKNTALLMSKGHMHSSRSVLSGI